MRLKSSHLSLDKVLNFFFSYIDSIYHKQIPFIRLILRACSFDIIKILSATPAASEETHNICNKMPLYQRNLDDFLLLSDQQNSCCNRFLGAVIALYLLSYAYSEQLNVL